MIGLTILAVFFGKLIFNGLAYRQVTGNIVPLLGILCFMTIGLSVPGMDGISGIFLGLALLGTIPQKKIAKKFNQPIQGVRSSKMHSPA